ncbi:A24 family peptidase [Salinibacterium sp. ZJ454]|uniref:prepilin peptidase n=1 Tax=Salinibacterium sp. ZJ454 TaxID=2708339 RepID=UPI001FBBBA9E|nr:A24 family peptidase [Salinibacterium sp. ZJ454]
MLTTGAGLFGALIGSFLNVVIFRVPAGRSIVSPPSACGACGAGIRPWDNIPVVSWLWLRGRCRDCGAKISARYPLVELGTALFFAVVGWWLLSAGSANGWGWAATLVVLAAFLYLAAISVALALIDMDTHTLPNKIVLPAYPVGAALLGAAALLASEPARLLPALVGAGALFGLYLVMALVYPGGMGFGDVKLAGVLGLYLGWVGWGSLAVGTFAAFLLGGLFAVILVIIRRAGRRTAIPFGPWMIVGAWVGMLGGDAIARAYLTMFGLV